MRYCPCVKRVVADRATARVFDAVTIGMNPCTPHRKAWVQPPTILPKPAPEPGSVVQITK